jgi:predicted HD phosphohydrolase
MVWLPGKSVWIKYLQLPMFQDVGGKHWPEYSCRHIRCQITYPELGRQVLPVGVPRLLRSRQLNRQISTSYYDRLLTSRDKASVRQEVPGKLVQVQPEEFICDPYVLEFLNLKDFRDCGKMS